MLNEPSVFEQLKFYCMFNCFKDMARKSQMDMKRTAVIKEDQEQKEMEKLRQHFAGGPDAERLAMTLKKLKSAYKEGKALLKRRHTRDLDDSYSNVSDE